MRPHDCFEKNLPLCRFALPFPKFPFEFNDVMYLDKLISWLGSDSEAALFTSEVSKRYLTGFGSEDGVLIVTKRGGEFLN